MEGIAAEGGPAEPPRMLKEHLGFVLNRAAGRVREEFGKALAPLLITPRHYGLLTLLAEAGGLTQQEAGERVFCDRTTMVNLMDDLERLGLAERVARPDDRRAYAIRLTRRGRLVQAKGRAIANRVNTRFLRPLTRGEVARLRELLERLISEPRPRSEEERQ